MSPRIQYEEWRPEPESLEVIEQANTIITEYLADGYDLTLRQLYYQFVSRDLLANNQKSYNRLGNIISKGRRAGLIDWDAIIDRTRNLQRDSTWKKPADIVAAVAEQFMYDRWKNQKTYVECWFEKDALMGVFERIAGELRVPFFSCRGYTSDSEVWSAARRLRQQSIMYDKEIVVLHFGDHDPSGLDMTRDIRERLQLFGAEYVEVRRLALNMPQVEQYEPPPNPAKVTDSRFDAYQKEYGDESWELDALDPKTLADLVRDEIESIIDREQWDEDEASENKAREELAAVSKNYTRVVRYLERGK
jgi:hypothetical protein